MPWTAWGRSDEARGKGLYPDPVVRRISPDPTEIPDLFVIVGLVGQASRRNVWRVYLNYALTEFVEVAEQDIVYVRTTDGERSRVWVRSGADVRHVVQRATRAEDAPRGGAYVARRPAAADEAYYLSGPIGGWGDWGGGRGFEEEGGPEPVGGTGCARCPGTR